MENGVTLNRIQEYMLSHLKPQTRRNDSQKLIKLFLVVQIALCEHHEFSYACLQMLRQLHVLHTCVGHIDLLLESLRLPIDRLENVSYRSKYVGVHKGTTY